KPVTNEAIPADGHPKDYNPIRKKPPVEKSAALSMAQSKNGSIATRRIAVLTAEGTDADILKELKKKAAARGASVKIIAPRLGTLKASDNSAIQVDETLFNTASVLYDAVY